MRRHVLISAILALVLTLTLSFAVALPTRSQSTSSIVTKLETLRSMLKSEHPSLANKVTAVIQQVEAGALNGALNKLQNDVEKSIEAKVENPEPLIALVKEIREDIEDMLHPKPPPTAPDFEISASPMRLEVAQGGSNTSIIAIVSINNFSQEVALTNSSDAVGVTLSLDPSKATPPPNGTITSTLRVEAASDAEPGQYEITVTGTSGSTTHSATIELTVTTSVTPDFSIMTSPSTLNIQQGDSSTSIIMITSQHGFNHSVNLEVTSPQITGVTTSLNPSQVIPPADSLAISVLTINVESNAVIGSYQVNITGQSALLVHNATISFEVTAPPTPPNPDFSIHAVPTELTIEQGDWATSTIIVVSLQGFNQQVNLSITAQPIPWVVLGLVPAQVTPAPGDFAAATLTVAVSKKATPSENTITINGTSNHTSRTVNVSFKIVLEKTPPQIVSLLRVIEKPAYNQTVEVVASVTDEVSGVKQVVLNYQHGTISKNVTMGMAVEQEEIFYRTFIPALPFHTFVEYLVYASDNAGNWAKSSTHGYEVGDPYPPVIGVPTWSPLEPAANEDITINVTVSKPINASSLEDVSVWYTNTTLGDLWQSIPMTQEGGNWTATLSNQSDTDVQFFVRATDTAGNAAESETVNLTVPAPSGIPLVWVLTAIIAILAVTGVVTTVYAMRRRQKSTGTSQAPTSSTTSA